MGSIDTFPPSSQVNTNLCMLIKCACDLKLRGLHKLCVDCTIKAQGCIRQIHTGLISWKKYRRKTLCVLSIRSN